MKSKIQYDEKPEPVDYHGQMVATLASKDAPETHKVIAGPFKRNSEELAFFSSAWDLLKTTDSLIVSTTSDGEPAVSILRHEGELDPWRTGGFTDDGDNMKIAIGLREGLKPEVVTRLKKFLPCFVKA